MRLTQQQAEAVRRLLHNSDFQEFMTALGVQAELLNTQLITTHDDLPRAQGRMQGLKMVLDAITTAEETYEKYIKRER